MTLSRKLKLGLALAALVVVAIAVLWLVALYGTPSVSAG